MSVSNPLGDRRRARRLTPLFFIPFLTLSSLANAQEISPYPEDYDVESQRRVYEQTVITRDGLRRDLSDARDAQTEAEGLYRDAVTALSTAETAKRELERSLREFDDAALELNRSIRNAEDQRGPLTRQIDEDGRRLSVLRRTSRIRQKRKEYEDADARAVQAERAAEIQAGPLEREVARKNASAVQAERIYNNANAELTEARRNAGPIGNLPQQIRNHRDEVARLTPIVSRQGIRFRELDAEAARLLRESKQLYERFKKERLRGNPNAREFAIAAAKKEEESKAKSTEARQVEANFRRNSAALLQNKNAADNKQVTLNTRQQANATVARLEPRIGGLRRAAVEARGEANRAQAQLDQLFASARNLRAEADRLFRIWDDARAPIERLARRIAENQSALEAIDTNVVTWRRQLAENERRARPLRAQLRNAEADIRIAEGNLDRYDRERVRLQGEVARIDRDLGNAEVDVTTADTRLREVERNYDQGLRDAPLVGQREGEDQGERAGTLRGRRDGAEKAREFATKDARFRGREDGQRIGKEKALTRLHSVELAKVELDNVRDQRRERGEGGVRRLGELREELARRREIAMREGAEFERPHRWRRNRDRGRDEPMDEIPWDQDPLYRPILDLSRHPIQIREGYQSGYRSGFYAQADKFYGDEIERAIEEELKRTEYKDLYENTRDRVADRVERDLDDLYSRNPVLIVAGAEARSDDRDGTIDPGDRFSLDLLIRNFGMQSSEPGEFTVELLRLPRGVTLDRGREEVPLVPITLHTEASVSNVHFLKVGEDVEAGAKLTLDFAVKRVGEVVQQISMDVKLGESLELSLAREIEADPRGGENTLVFRIKNPKRLPTGPLRVRLVSTDYEAEFVGENDIELREGVRANGEIEVEFKFKPYYRDLPERFEFLLTVSKGRERRISKEIVVPVGRR